MRYFKALVENNYYTLRPKVALWMTRELPLAQNNLMVIIVNMIANFLRRFL